MLSNASRKYQIAIVIIFIIGIFLRIASFSWNQYIHGDVGHYSAAAESIIYRGDFLIDTNATHPHFYSLVEKGGKFLDHNPLWSILGSALVLVFGVSGFTALKILSLASGILLLWVLYRFAHQVCGESGALLVLVLSAFSYLLIDFSGNGSFYIFQALLYVLFLLLLMSPLPRARVWQIGVLLGIGVLLNQQAIVLWVSYTAYTMIYFWSNRREALVRIVLGTAIMSLFFIPWMARNYVFVRTPIIPTDIAYIWEKSGVAKTIINGVISYHVTSGTLFDLIRRSIFFWLPHNLYFINRKLFILAPIIYIASLCLIAEVWNRERRGQMHKLIPTVLVVLFHTLLSSAWPIAKFRYLVPLLPLVLILGAYYMFVLVRQGAWRNRIVTASIVLILGISLLTYFDIPSHTYYYDGVLTTDNFGKQGELEFIQSQNIPPES